LNEATVQKLLDEEIQDLETLSILSEEDIENLELKTGQKARVRSLRRRQETGTGEQVSGTYKTMTVKQQSSFQNDETHKEPRFVKCSSNKRFPVEKRTSDTMDSKTGKRVPVTKNFTGHIHISSSSSSGEFAHACYALTI
jgi:hypothetical protein